MSISATQYTITDLTDGLTYYLEPSAYTIVKDAVDVATDGTHSAVTFTGKQNLGGVVTSGIGFLTIQKADNTYVYGNATTATALSSPYTYTPATNVDTAYFTAKLYSQATIAGATLYSQIAIPVAFKGATGAIKYTWIKYADTSAGAGLSDSATGKRFLGIATNKDSSTESTTPGDYAWSPLYDNVQVGGRNLLRNTQTIPTAEYKTSDTYLGFTIARTPGVTTGYQDTIQLQTINIPDYTTYTLSFYAKASESMTIYNYFYSPNTTLTAITSTGQTSTGADGGVLVSITTEWQRYWIVWTQSTTTAVKYVVVGRNLSTIKPSVTVEIAGVKFEKGNIATDWSPAPEDVDASINDLADVVTSKTTIYYTNDPSSLGTIDYGSLVYDSNGNISRYDADDGSGNPGWVDITNEFLGVALDAANAAQTVADSKITTYAQPSTDIPSGIIHDGDLWFKTDEGNKLYRYNAPFATWVPFQDQTIITTNNELTGIIETIVGGTRIYRQATAPASGMGVNDLWFDTDAGNTCFKYNGSAWIAYSFSNLIAKIDGVANTIYNSDQIITTVTGSTVYTNALASKANNTDLANYVTSTTFSNQTTTTNNSITTAITTATNNAIADATGKYSVATTIISTYFIQETEGLRIRKNDGLTDKFSMLLTNAELGFYENTSRLAYLSNSKLFIKNAHVLDMLTIGKEDASEGFVDIDTIIESSSGGLTAVWRAS